MAIKPLGLGYGFEPAAGIADGLGAPEQQKSAFAQREMESRDHLGLGLRTQIDQQVAAGHEIKARKWRIRQDILNRKNHRRTQLRQHTVAAIFLQEKTG